MQDTTEVKILAKSSQESARSLSQNPLPTIMAFAGYVYLETQAPCSNVWLKQPSFQNGRTEVA